jgi:hypothetical protein
LFTIFLISSADNTCRTIVENIKTVLPLISAHEHLSGLFQAVVAVCSGQNLKCIDVTKALDIDKRSSSYGKRKRLAFEQQYPNLQLLTSPILTKSKLNPIVVQKVQQFIENNITASSSTSNVRKKKINGIENIKVKHWRTESLEQLYNTYIDSHPQHWISFSAFYSKIPWYVHIKPKRSGLCIHHDKAFRIIKILQKLRKTWHQNCTCTCIFCQNTGCNHGHKQDCLEGNCKHCSKICCPLEKTNVLCNYTLVEYAYEKTNKGNKKLRQFTNNYTKSRLEFLKLWKLEMIQFKLHSDHCKYHKQQMENLFEIQKHHTDMVIARWDFAENYVHQNASMVSTEHYGKEQSQLLIVSYWYHKQDSTPTNPSIQLKYMAFTSDYLAHNTLFFKKCLDIFITKLEVSLPFAMKYLVLLSDGCQQHFKNKRSYNNISILSATHGINFNNIV